MLTSLLRGVVLFILSNIFILLMFNVMAEYTFMPVLEKENIKAFITENIFNKTSIDQFCNSSCSSMRELYDACMNQCANATALSTSLLIGKINDVYAQKMIMGNSLDDLINLQKSLFIPSVIIAIISIALMFFISKNPFKVLGTNLLVLGLSSLFLYFALKKIIEGIVPASAFGAALALIDYIQSGFIGFYNFGLLFLAGGVALYFVHFLVQKIRKVPDKNIKPKQVVEQGEADYSGRSA